MLMSLLLTTTFAITNPTLEQRHEVVKIDTTGMQLPKEFIVRDAFGIERAWQLSQEGELLLYVHVRPGGTAKFTISEGVPAPQESWVGGRHYAERLDDIAFENDRIGFRLYGPALQRKGEKGFGHDVWVKRTPELILDDLYRNDPRMSFHLDYGKGLDCYGVGPTLGLGTPALMEEGKFIFPWCYENYKILEKGPLRFVVQVDFPATADGIKEHRILTLDRGSNFCEATVWYDGLKKPQDLAAGFAIRPTSPEFVVAGKDYICYADPTVDPERHQFQIYVALLFPEETIETTVTEGHAVGIRKQYAGDKFHYYFGAAWSEFDVRSQQEWQIRIESKLKALRNPLKIVIKPIG